MTTEYDVIRAMFEAKQARDMADMLKVNQELKPLVQKSQDQLQGKIDINTLIPPSKQAQ